MADRAARQRHVTAGCCRNIIGVARIIGNAHYARTGGHMSAMKSLVAASLALTTWAVRANAAKGIMLEAIHKS